MADLDLPSKVPEGSQTEMPKIRTIGHVGMRLGKHLKGLIIKEEVNCSSTTTELRGSKYL